METKTINELILCDCHCPEHQMIMSYNKEVFDIDDKENIWYCENVYVHYHLQGHSFWERLKNGINHILGKKSRYGDFGEIVLDADDDTIAKFQRVTDKLKEIQTSRKIHEEHFQKKEK